MKKTSSRSKWFSFKKPFSNHPANYVSQAIIDIASAKLSNIALHKAYAKQQRLWTILDGSSLYINEIINVPSLKAETFVFLNRLFHKKTSILLCHKNKKQQQLIRNSPLHSSLQDQEIIPHFLTNKKPSMHFRKQTKISTVFNLSNIKLSATQSSLLEKCISFCPTHKLDLVELCHDINEYTSLLRNKEFFYSENSSSRSNRSVNPFKAASNWTAPLGRNNNLDSYIHKIEKELDVLVLDLSASKVKLHDNLSSNQRKALHDLKSNNNIVIKPADKGDSIAIMNKDNYMKETCTYLHDGRFYKKIDNDPTPTLTNKLKLLINELQPNLQNDVLKLIPSHPRLSTFYTIPKVHKLPNLEVSTRRSSNPDNFIIEAQRLNINPPGRPIVSGIGTLTEHVSAFVDREFQPLLANILSYIKDTTDFKNKLSRFNNSPDNTILVTLDGTALYSNIPHNDGIGACKKHLDRRALSTTSSEDICQLNKFILENNVFSFNDEYFLQVCGTAMGTRMAPCYANIFRAELEENFLSGYPYKPLAHYRYIDDIFIIWSHGLDILHDFINNQHSNIIFTSNISTTSVNFLDVTIDLHGGHTSTKTYTKSTDTHACHSYNSFHPRHIKQSIIYSQFLRYKRICYNDEIFLNDATKLFRYFLARQYPFSDILHHFNKVKQIDRHKLLSHTPNSNTAIFA